MSRLRPTLLLLSLLSFAACGPSTEEPPAPVPASAHEAADAVAGAYRLVSVNEVPLPSRIGMVDECEVQLTKGTLTLDAAAGYNLDVLARAVCDEEEDSEAQIMDRATSRGPYTVQGFEIRFSPALVEAEGVEEGQTSEELAEDMLEEDLEESVETPELYDATQFAGVGTIRDSLLTVRLADDLTTLSFVRK